MMKKVLLCLGLLLLLCPIYETTTMKHYNEADDEESNNNVYIQTDRVVYVVFSKMPIVVIPFCMMMESCIVTR